MYELGRLPSSESPRGPNITGKRFSYRKQIRVNRSAWIAAKEAKEEAIEEDKEKHLPLSKGI